jgi:hypothetical protein
MRGVFVCIRAPSVRYGVSARTGRLVVSVGSAVGVPLVDRHPPVVPATFRKLDALRC